MRVALYVRRSTNEKLQADSLRVQEQGLRRYAREHDMEVVAVYKDSGSGTTVKKRPQFLKMISDAEKERMFEAVLVRDVTRFGRFFDADEPAFWELLLLGHGGVKTIYVEEVFGADTSSPMAGLVKSVRRVMASEYVRDKSRMVRYSQSRTTRLGFHACGTAPYGLKRIMVARDGTYLQDLAPGEWKGLANRRTKLAPGDPEKLEIVRRIFNAYDEGVTIPEITQRLNADAVPAPRGSTWYQPTVSAILNSTAYIGDAEYLIRHKGLTDPLPLNAVPDLNVTSFSAFEPVIRRDLWDRVHRRMSEKTRRRSNADLIEDFRIAFEACGFVDCENMLTRLPQAANWLTYEHRFGDPENTLRIAYRDVIDAKIDTIIAMLSESFDVARDGQDVVLDSAMRVRLLAVFPHRRQGFLYWRVKHEDGAHQAVVAFGIDRHCAVTDDVFVIRSSALIARRKGVFIRVDKDVARTALEQLATHLRWMREFFGNADAESVFIDAAQRMPLLNLAELSRTLGWPDRVVARMYRRVVAKGIYLPPSLKQAGRRIAVICGRCGESRSVRPSRALVLRSNFCFKCSGPSRSRKIKVQCPSCGSVVYLSPSSVKKMPNGANRICKNCINTKRLRKGLRYRKRRTSVM